MLKSLQRIGGQFYTVGSMPTLQGHSKEINEHLECAGVVYMKSKGRRYRTIDSMHPSCLGIAQVPVFGMAVSVKNCVFISFTDLALSSAFLALILCSFEPIYIIVIP